jgi:alcohol dehydrogenase, propanol-preferring
MRAMILEEAKTPLILKELPLPEPKRGQVRIRVEACAVCRTDLHIIDGELYDPKLPLILGHQVVGRIDSPSRRFKQGARVGLPWLGKSCGHCFFCQNERENLCDTPTFTGYTINGGYAEYCIADEDFIFPISEERSPIDAAPLLCAGMIGYRSLRMAGDARNIGFYGFGAAAHLLIQVALYQGREVYAFTRKGDIETQEEAKRLGATWASDSETLPPEPLDAAILFAPVGNLVPMALQAVRKGGIVVCGGIHMSDIPSFPYSLLWGERVLRSVANLTRQDGKEFLEIAQKIPIKTHVRTYPLEEANKALQDLREGGVSGSAVLIP